MADPGGGSGRPPGQCTCGKDIDETETHCFACGHCVNLKTPLHSENREHLLRIDGTTLHLRLELEPDGCKENANKEAENTSSPEVSDKDSYVRHVSREADVLLKVDENGKKGPGDDTKTAKQCVDNRKERSNDVTSHPDADNRYATPGDDTTMSHQDVDNGNERPDDDTETSHQDADNREVRLDDDATTSLQDPDHRNNNRYAGLGDVTTSHQDAENQNARLDDDSHEDAYNRKVRPVDDAETSHQDADNRDAMLDDDTAMSHQDVDNGSEALDDVKEISHEDADNREVRPVGDATTSHPDADNRVARLGDDTSMSHQDVDNGNEILDDTTTSHQNADNRNMSLDDDSHEDANNRKVRPDQDADNRVKSLGDDTTSHQGVDNGNEILDDVKTSHQEADNRDARLDDDKTMLPQDIDNGNERLGDVTTAHQDGENRNARLDDDSNEDARNRKVKPVDDATTSHPDADNRDVGLGNDKTKSHQDVDNGNERLDDDSHEDADNREVRPVDDATTSNPDADNRDGRLGDDKTKSNQDVDNGNERLDDDSHEDADKRDARPDEETLMSHLDADNDHERPDDDAEKSHPYADNREVRPVDDATTSHPDADNRVARQGDDTTISHQDADNGNEIIDVKEISHKDAENREVRPVDDATITLQYSENRDARTGDDAITSRQDADNRNERPDNDTGTFERDVIHPNNRTGDEANTSQQDTAERTDDVALSSDQGDVDMTIHDVVAIEQCKGQMDTDASEIQTEDVAMSPKLADADKTIHNVVAVVRCKEPMDTEAVHESEPHGGKHLEAKEENVATCPVKQQDVEHLLCDGKWFNEQCNTPVDPAERFCVVCGQEYKYVKCQGSSNDTGAPCKMLVEPGHSCRQCGKVAEPKQAAAETEMQSASGTLGHSYDLRSKQSPNNQLCDKKDVKSNPPGDGGTTSKSTETPGCQKALSSFGNVVADDSSLKNNMAHSTLQKDDISETNTAASVGTDKPDTETRKDSDVTAGQDMPKTDNQEKEPDKDDKINPADGQNIVAVDQAKAATRDVERSGPLGGNGKQQNKDISKKGRNATNANVLPPQLQNTTYGGKIVNFYVILHKAFDYNRSKDTVCIRFGDPSLGGWKDRKRWHQMEKVRELHGGYVLFQYALELPLTIIGQVKYKYMFVHPGGVLKGHHNEWIQDVTKDQQKRTNRSLSLNQGRDVYQQFDGLMYPPPQDQGSKNIFKAAFRYMTSASEKERMEEIREVTLAMLPRLHYFRFEQRAGQEHDRVVSPDEVFQQMDSVYQYMDKSFKLDERKKRTLWKEAIWVYLKPWKEFMKAQLQAKAPTTKEKAEMRLLSAVMILQIIAKFDGHLLAELIDLDVVLECLLLRPYGDGRTLPFKEIIERNFKDENKSVLRPLLVTITWLMQHSQDRDYLIPQKSLYLVPLIHMLTEPPDSPQCYQVSHLTGGWWGVRQFSAAQERFKQNMDFKDRLQLKFLTEKLSPLFSVDPLLPRSIMTVFSWRHLKEAVCLQCFPPDACIALCYHFINEKRDSNSDDQKVVESVLESVVEKINNLASTPEVQLRHNFEQRGRDAMNLSRLSTNLLKLMLEETGAANRVWYRARLLVVYVADVVAAAVRYLIMLQKVHQVKTMVDLTKRVEDTVTWSTNSILTWLRRIFGTWMIRDSKGQVYYNHTESLEMEIEIFGRLLAIDFSLGDKNEDWQRIFKERLKERIQQITPQDRVEIYCCYLNCDENQGHKRVEEVFSDAAFSVLNEVDILGVAGHKSISNYRYLVSTKFRTAWMKEVGTENRKRILHHMLTWSSFPGYIEILYNGKADKILEDELKQKMVVAASILTDLHERLLMCKVTVAELETIMQNKESFINLCVNLLTGKRTKQKKTYYDEASKKKESAALSKFLDIRQHEFDYYRQTCEKLQVLVNACSSIPCVDIEALQGLINRNVSNEILSDVVTPLPHDGDYRRGFPKPEIKAFPISEEVVAGLDNIKVIDSSRTLKSIWYRFGEFQTKEIQSRGDGHRMNIEEAIEDIWSPTWKEWKQIIQKLKMGNATLGDVDKYFGMIEEDRIRKELENMKDWGDQSLNVRSVVEKIGLYYQMDNCSKAVKAILQVKDELQLTGDFTPVEMVANVEQNKKQTLNQMDKTRVETWEALKKITTKQIDCLRAVSECSQLIKWLTEIGGTKDFITTKDLITFVDLASISAGETDYEMHRVHMLHSVITGFAPIICDLPKDSSAETLISRCEIVWRAMEADPKLLKNLQDTQGQLDWLKTVKESHGSVEVSSLGEAHAINARGIYRVGNVGRGIKKTVDVIQLIVPGGKDGDEQKQYSFHQLNELQSKLMLVSTSKREGDDDKHAIDRFTEIFEGVTTLAKVYVKICTAGNVLFQDWECTFFCDPQRNVNIQVNIQLKSAILTDQNQGHIIDQIDDLVKFMEECLHDWKNHIQEQRSTFPHLNHFTTSQIVTLRGEFAKIRNKEAVYITTYDMLHNIKHDCSHEDLVASVRGAENSLRELSVQEQEASKSVEPKEDEEEEDSSDVQEVIRKVMDGGVSENLARRAVKECGPDVDDCVLWLYENEDKEEDDDEGGVPDGSSDSDDDALMDRDQLQPSMRAVTSQLYQRLDRSKTRLTHQLYDLWHGYLENAGTSVKDYLSVKHLGLILDTLSIRENVEVQRSFPPVLRLDRPNLIVCPEVEVYNTTLSLYMGDKADVVPLPSDDEVLLCTSDTTAEEVELLFQRATNDTNKQGKIFCLVNADQLDYDVGDLIERSLDNHIKAKKDFRLVIICSSEREDTSRIVTALDRDRTSLIPRPAKEVLDYLQQQFQKDLGYCNGKSAADVDFEKLSVRLVKSARAGVGKSLLIRKRSELLGSQQLTIRLHEKHMTDAALVDKLIEKRGHLTERMEPTLLHIDIGHDVVEGVDHVLFNLLILRCIKDATGRCWRRHPSDLYMIENLPLLKQEIQRTTQSTKVQYVHQMLNILPCVTCRPPKETLAILMGENEVEDLEHVCLTYEDILRSEEITRPCNKLRAMSAEPTTPVVPFSSTSLLELLLNHCGVENGDPSWSELYNFTSFLNTQLADAEKSNFCSDSAQEYLPGFAVFVVKFMVQMSKDFATSSLVLSEETPQLLQPQVRVDEERNDDDDDDHLLALRRRWETSPHPYIFFNPDGHSFSFLGFNIDRRTGNLIDSQTGEVLNRNIMSPQLFDALISNKVDLKENFDTFGKGDKILKLSQVMGLELDEVHDPDETYELTTDNVKKMLAIYMRFRCGIPVVVMGETGCGKTRLIKFMCDLQTRPQGNDDEEEDLKNMVLMKVHGGTTHGDIIEKVKEAQELAASNKQHYPKMFTILFFDEANTTESIGLIKEIMCDRSMNGEQIEESTGLKFVAACNPYRKHTPDMIRRLEQAGLGYNVKANKTMDKLGRVPMRQLVYRVQPLPQSMLPLVWDFGQLSDNAEKMYIRQIVQRCMDDEPIPQEPLLRDVITNILAASQCFMREQKNECSFVSLRDVERTMNVMAWFFEHSRLINQLLNEDSDDMEEGDDEIEDFTRALVLALGVCYHACLKKDTRQDYRECVGQYFVRPCALPNADDCILEEISRCQDMFLKQCNIQTPNIAPNQALKENLFMMVVCIELRIPLFLVGKPGSSKSLAKLIVMDAMQGETAKSPLFRSLKQVHMVSFQCSPLATPDGIKGTFNQCARFQQGKNLDHFVSVVVLDEVGLAEDSPRMPLKTLHPLLEDGTCGGDDKPADYKKVGFIGISNWALDPAKMNRGILVQRDSPDEEELIKSAVGICSSEKEVFEDIRPLIPEMAKAYLELYDSRREIREFFGLRDFYSLVKMMYAFAKKSGAVPSWRQLEHAVRRNFGGIEDVKPVEVFRKRFPNLSSDRRMNDPDCDTEGLIRACLSADDASTESRYLLILTENYAALGILKQHLLSREDLIVIFGSSFRNDQEYTQVCRNINRIKNCMETGKTVVLLNLESLYESLYDALNQYYVYMGDVRFVDLGLGTHRVKCRVHPKFRLIVVAEKNIVYEKFPIPLINRLEKHVLAMTTILSEKQIEVTNRVEKWVKDFVTPRFPMQQQVRRKAKEISPGDVFCGYHDDTAASIVLQVSKEVGASEDGGGWAADVFNRCKDILLLCATEEAVVRLKCTRLVFEWKGLFDKYYHEQAHGSLPEHIQWLVEKQTTNEGIFLEVTTKSHLLAKKDAKSLSRRLRLGKNFKLQALQAMGTKQQFSRELENFFNQKNEDRLMLLQCDSGDRNSNLIACARYQIMEEYAKAKDKMMGKAHFVFIIQMPRVMAGSFIGFQGGKWHSVYLDDLRTSKQLAAMELSERSIGDLIKEALVKEGTLTGQGSGSLVLNDDVPLKGPLTLPQFRREAGGKISTDGVNLAHPETSPVEPSPEMQGGVFFGGRVQEHVGCGNRDTKAIQSDGPHVLDVDSLIRCCIQSAASMVKDPENVPNNRPTERLHIIFEEFSDNNAKIALMTAIKVRLDQLFQEKEDKTSVQTLARDWLCKEAAAAESINYAGTFRRAVQMVMEKKVMPILAGIVAYVDTNCNLDILKRKETQVDDVIRELWFRMFSERQVSKLSYGQFQSPGSQVEMSEMITVQTGTAHHLFNPHFPFSWEVYSQMQLIIQTAGTEVEEITLTCLSLFNDSHIGKFLANFLEEQSATVKDELMELYLKDFVHMCFKVDDDDMEELLMKTLKIAFTENSGTMQLEGEDVTQLTIPKLHLTYARFQERLDHFFSACSVWPDCMVSLQGNVDHELSQTVTEMTLDVNVFVHMINFIDSLQDKLKKPKTRKSWLEQVKALKPVIERIMQHFTCNTKESFGPICKKYMDKYRPLWTRIYIVQLFIDHVCPPHNKDEAKRVDSMALLWRFLGNDSDFKTAASVTKVAKFLKTCKNKCVQELYENHFKCHGCKETKKDPVKLPCDHLLCRDCLRSQFEANNPICLDCKNPIPDEFKTPEEADNMEADSAYNKYISASNQFFMDLISQLCFAEDSPPEKEVVDILMSYVIHDYEPCDQDQVRCSKTKQFTVYQECVDATPVLRSLLLQMLLRYNTDEVREHLQLFFEKSQQFIENPEHVIQLSLLCARCFEDSYYSQCSAQSTDIRSTRIRMAIDHLETACDDLDKEVINIKKIEAIAKIRFGLGIASEMMYKIHVANEEGHVMAEVKRLWQAAWRIHETSTSKWPRLYLAKQLCRTYGMDSLHLVAEVDYLKWILPDEAQGQQNDLVDRFILSSDVYTRLRDSVGEVTHGDPPENFITVCAGLPGKNQVKEIACLLALHREVLTQNRFEVNIEHRISNKIITDLLRVCTDQGFMRNKPALHDILGQSMSERLPPQPLIADNTTKAIHDLLVLFNLVMQSWKTAPALLRPLRTIMSEPNKMAASYLPTMPQDHLEDVRNVILAHRTEEENPVFFVCSNGHPYIIGDCGRPWFTDKCPTCRETIGGERHIAEKGNVKLQNRDTIETGHTLGQADMHDLVPIPERNLSPAVTVVLRLLLHMSMHIGTNHDEQTIAEMITPGIEIGEVRQFLLHHIRHDIQLLGRALAKSPDDCLSLMTQLISHDFMEKRKVDDRFNLELNSKEARQQWETAFSEKYVKPILQDLDVRVQNITERLLSDKRLPNNPLIKIVHEVITLGDEVNINQIHDSHIMWQHRSRVTVDHLTQLMNENTQNEEGETRILRHFLQEEHHLRAMCHLPGIVKLQQLLLHKYQRRLNQADAKLIKVGQFLMECGDAQRAEIKSLIDDFAEAWKCVRETLQTYRASGYTLPRKDCDLLIDDDTPISMLIPSQHELGLCSIMLVEFLTRKHNEFIMAYCRYKGKDSSELSEFSVREVTPAHLISYDPERDLLPMVIAHCNYSLEVGRGTVISYDFKGIERQLEERLLRGKPKLRFEISTIVFRGVYSSAFQFQSLRSKIPQELLSHAVQMQIVQECRTQYQQIFEMVTVLDVAIHFLLSVGGDPDTELMSFMCDTLKMERNIFTPQIHQHCRLMHVQCLWLLLNMEGSKQMHFFKQEPFVNVAEDYQEALSPAEVNHLHQALQQLNIDTFVTELHECILFNINAQQNRNAEDASDNASYRLADVMKEYINSKDGREIPLLSKGAFPEDILVKHAVSAWTEAVTVLNKEELNRGWITR